MDTTTATEAASQAAWWLELMKLGVFAFFVTGLLEVWKDLRDGVRLKGDERGAAITRVMNFAVAAYACYVFDYGVIARVIEVGEKARSTAAFVDYFGTASIVRLGAVAIFEKFAVIIASYKQKRNGVGKPPGELTP